MAQPLANEPRDLLLGPDNDLVITNGDLDWARGITAVGQACRIAMQMFAGEWFLNLDVGIPYWTKILAQKPATAIAAARAAFRTELEAVDGVLEVLRMDVTYDNGTRQMSVTWQVRTALGDTPVDILTDVVAGVIGVSA